MRTFIDSSSERTVYFPAGNWYDYNTNKKYEGGKTYTISMSLDQIPMFVKDNSILPLAEPVEYVTPNTVFNISCKIYGNPTVPIQLFEDNSTNFSYEKGTYTRIHLLWNGKKGAISRVGNYKQAVYNIKGWETVVTN